MSHLKQIITTPLFYVNSKPHIGHLYSMLYADAIAKHHKAALLTGTDEHGQKVFKSAQDQNTKQYCDVISQQFKDMADKHIQYNHFIRTTDQAHINRVQNVWNTLLKGGYITKGKYAGYYNVIEESFVNYETNTFVEEDNYFFKMDKEFTTNFISKIEQYKSELATHQLDQICISRPQHRQLWGIEVPNDPNNHIYVWLDALCGYMLNQPMHYKHVIGKDIIKFHAIYWPNFMKAINNESQIELIVHNHWIRENKKMSKSLNNVVDPLTLMYTPEQIRLYFLTQGPQNYDVGFDEKALEKCWNDYVDSFNNILYRLFTPKIFKPNQIYYRVNGNNEPLEQFKVLSQNVGKLMDQNKIVEAYIELRKIFQLINQYINAQTPWKQSDTKEQTLAVCCIMLSITQQLLQPIIPQKLLISPQFTKIPQEDQQISVDTSRHQQLRLDKFN